MFGQNAEILMLNLAVHVLTARPYRLRVNMSSISYKLRTAFFMFVMILRKLSWVGKFEEISCMSVRKLLLDIREH